MRVFRKIIAGLVPLGPVAYRKPSRSLEDRNVVSRRIPASMGVPLNPLEGAGMSAGNYGRQTPYLFNAVPIVVGRAVNGAGNIVSGSRLGGLINGSE